MTIPRRWIQSYEGRPIDVLNPQASSFTIKDVAHALALKNRFNGMTRVPYSVGEHCVRGAFLIAKSYGYAGGNSISPEARTAALPFLLHELGEVALPDIPTPLKQFVRVTDEDTELSKAWEDLPSWTELEDRHETAILEALNKSHWLHWIHSAEVKAMDLQMLAWEARDLLGPAPSDWWSDGDRPVPASEEKLHPQLWYLVENQFLYFYRLLTGEEI